MAELFEPRDIEYIQYWKTCSANQRALSSDDSAFIESLRDKLKTLTERDKEQLCLVYARLDTKLKGKFYVGANAPRTQAKTN